MKLIESEASDGHVAEQLFMGWFNEPSNIDRAVRWYSLASEKGSSSASLQLHFLYEKRPEIKDDLIAQKFLILADKQGNKFANLLLAQKYSLSDSEDLLNEAIRRYEVAINELNSDSSVGRNLKFYYSQEIGSLKRKLVAHGFKVR